MSTHLGKSRIADNARVRHTYLPWFTYIRARESSHDSMNEDGVHKNDI